MEYCLSRHTIELYVIRTAQQQGSPVNESMSQNSDYYGDKIKS